MPTDEIFQGLHILDTLWRVMLAFALALPLGWERGTGRYGVGLRTFPIVAMAACGYALVAKELPGATPAEQGRLLQGLLAGIGFIGGGAILKEGGAVKGLVTAASIWNTGAIGVAVAYDREEIALVLSVINFFALLLLTPIARSNREDDTPSPASRENKSNFEHEEREGP